MYAIYGDIYHQYTPNVSIYTSTMDPMGHEKLSMHFKLSMFRRLNKLSDDCFTEISTQFFKQMESSG